MELWTFADGVPNATTLPCGCRRSAERVFPAHSAPIPPVAAEQSAIETDEERYEQAERRLFAQDEMVMRCLYVVLGLLAVAGVVVQLGHHYHWWPEASFLSESARSTSESRPGGGSR